MNPETSQNQVPENPHTWVRKKERKCVWEYLKIKTLPERDLNMI